MCFRCSAFSLISKSAGKLWCLYCSQFMVGILFLILNHVFTGWQRICIQKVFFQVFNFWNKINIFYCQVTRYSQIVSVTYRLLSHWINALIPSMITWTEVSAQTVLQGAVWSGSALLLAFSDILDKKFVLLKFQNGGILEVSRVEC